MRLLIVALCSIFITTIGVTYAIVEESDAPFIYYYSPSERAIIIERADGADRHVLMQELFSNPERQIRGPRWSPSGKWLHWTIDGFTETSDFQTSYALYYDLTTLVIVPEEARFSPTDDIYFQLTDYSERREVSVIDFATREILALFDAPPESTAFYWSLDGDFITYWVVGPDEANDTFFVTPIDSVQDTYHFHANYDFYLFSDSLRGQHLLYVNPDNQTLELGNVLTGDVYSLRSFSFPEIRYIAWSPDRSHALIFYWEGYSRERTIEAAFLLSTNDGLLEPLDDFVGVVPPYSTEWSPNNNGFLMTQHLATDYDVLQVVYYEVVRNDNTISIELVESFSTVHADYSSDGRSIYIFYPDRIDIFDTQSHTIINEILDLPNNFRRLAPNGQTIAYVSSQEKRRPAKVLFNWSDGTSTVYPVENEAGRVDFRHFGLISSVEDIRWHPQSEWIRFAERVSEQAEYYCMFSFGDLSGEFYRQLPLPYSCEFTIVDGVPQWLPDNVPLDDLN